MTRKEILTIKPPQKYKEGVMKYSEGLDNIPEKIDYLKNGYNLQEACKMELLIRIERLKYILELLEEESIEERKETENIIHQCIQQYNQM